MSKKVIISKRPTSVKEEVIADSWVENRELEQKMKRLTIDIPEDLHREIKSQCAMRGTKIADEVRIILFEKYRKS